MKKSFITLAIASLAVASANAAPKANSVYVGAKVGYASFHDGLRQIDAKNGGTYGLNRHSPTFGGFVGYQIVDNLAAEVGYDFYGRDRGSQKRARGKKDKETFKHTVHGANLALKGHYEVIRGLDTYAKVGVALANNRYKTVNVANYARLETQNRFQSSLLLGAGLEYALTPSLGARIEYQWLNNAGKGLEPVLAHMKAGDYRPDVSSVSAGLTYRFGQHTARPVAPASKTITKNFAFSSDVLFDFGQADLKPAAAVALDSAHAEIQSLGLDNFAIEVKGYTDRIGKDEPNLALSQRRAESVASYMTSKGVAPETITAVGYGKANPVTGSTCDEVKGRQALIACLAPDRRVELQVQGTSTETVSM